MGTQTNKWNNAIIILLLSLMVSIMSYQAVKTDTYIQTNSEEHAMLIKQLMEETSFTHSVYKYEIQENTRLRKLCVKKLNLIK